MYKTILVVDDEESICQSLQGILSDEGYEVRTVGSGEETLKAIEEDLPDLVLLDIQLPGMDGYAVARALREKPALHDVPIVAVTSYAMAGDREKTIAAGCNGYMEKPINPETFVSEIERHLENAPGKSTHE